MRKEGLTGTAWSPAFPWLPANCEGLWPLGDARYAGDEKYTTSVLATADDYSDPDHGPDNFAALDLSKIGDIPRSRFLAGSDLLFGSQPGATRW